MKIPCYLAGKLSLVFPIYAIIVT